ncbi:transcriptional regulator, TetR family [Klenkia marina]|uniref:Transcriptional regulator, TetR family n=1 Tax=Klenkia marina TaxID=1960309 RepID=A0A1G4XSA2_9ACTN|nr:TetR family transcriptional regulator C-terminal domain-containing protein [Klenkia marina]SCX44072.1 transcriptional regulator, TetR family [Klenkia marina]
MPRTVDVDARRDRLVAAVCEVAVRDGLDAVTARSVAAAAGLSLGAVTRTFASQEQLHAAAMRAVAERVAARSAAVPRIGDPVRCALALLDQVMPFAEETRAEAQVYYAYVARARAVPALAAIADEVDAALLASCAEVVALVAPGARPAAVVELHALTEGIAFGLVTWPHRRDAAEQRQVLADWLVRACG